MYKVDNSVDKYTAGMSDLNQEERDQRLVVLEAFCTFVERSPQQMIDEIYDIDTHKYKKRGFYTKQVKEFIQIGDGTERERNIRGNVIRAFFIANGRRIPVEKPAWF